MPLPSFLRDRTPRQLVAYATGFLAVTTTIGVLAGVWRGFTDLLVYRLGAQTLIDGNPVYGELPALPDGTKLPFTYPPLATVVFTPFAVAPVWLAATVMFALSLAAIGLTVWLVLDRIRPDIDPTTRLAAVIAIVAFAQYLEPVRTTLGYGQINALLMAAVAWDLLSRSSRWPRGLLIGVAIAIKLTPGGFLLLFLLRKDWRAIATTIASFVVVSGLAWAVSPSDSHTYWFTKIQETGRIGAPYFAYNQSLNGFVTRFGLPSSAGTALWAVLVVATIVLAAVWMRRLLTDGDLTAAVLVNAAAILLVSPVSWSHHWVWAAPALLVVWNRVFTSDVGTPFRVAAWAGLIVFYAGVHALMPTHDDRELQWSWWMHVLGSSYVILTFGALAVGAWTSVRRPVAA